MPLRSHIATSGELGRDEGLALPPLASTGSLDGAVWCETVEGVGAIILIRLP